MIIRWSHNDYWFIGLGMSYNFGYFTIIPPLQNFQVIAKKYVCIVCPTNSLLSNTFFRPSCNSNYIFSFKLFTTREVPASPRTFRSQLIRNKSPNIDLTFEYFSHDIFQFPTPTKISNRSSQKFIKNTHYAEFLIYQKISSYFTEYLVRIMERK